MTPSFHFFTLVTKDNQYGPLRASLAEVGFDETNSVFTILDNRKGNAHEPYSAITRAVWTAQAPYVVFCHQSLLFYHGPEALLAAIEDVDRLDPKWAVLGNVGVMSSFEMAVCLEDPDMVLDSKNLPARVLTLDENFLVIRRDSGVDCSPELSGFHLYAADLCLNAYLKGYTVWAIEYRLRHVRSTVDHKGLHRTARKFHRAWRARIKGAIIINPVVAIVFSPVPFLFAATNRDGVQRRLMNRARGARTLDYLLRHRRPNWLPLSRFTDEDPRAPRLTKSVRALDALLRRGKPIWSPSARYEDYDVEDLERRWARIAEAEEWIEKNGDAFNSR